jgi:chemotaxis protein methyltransferase CheR
MDSARPGRGHPLVDGEFPLTIEDFRAIAAMLHADAGIALSEAKATLVYSRLAKRLRALGLRSFREYRALVAASESGEERRQMLTALTTNVTCFFREPHHFKHLKTVVLPALLKEARRGGRVRLWSAACSTGQEPYSMALTILSLMPDAAGLDVKVLATDIDPVVLAEGRAGAYDEANIAAVPSDLRQRWFTRAFESEGKKGWRVADEVRRLVAFRELNLIGSWPMKGRFQVIMCRNVVIYFAEETQTKVWNRLMPLVEPGGHLYIGHSERLTGEAVRHFESAGITTYRRRMETRP